MNKIKSTKRALIMSAAAVLMSISMLIGTTFAWFTDTASTGVNKIVSGSLKVDIIGKDSDAHIDTLNFKNAAGAEGEALLWEPGCRYLTEGFRIANKGNLALKWKAQVNKGATAANEGNFDLLDVIDFYLVTKAADGTKTETALDEFTGNLKKTETSEVYYIKGVMKTTAGNDYQGLTLDGITITVIATQDTVEYDSFDNTYDKDATYPVTDNNELKDAINNATDGSTVLIASGEYTLSDPAEISKIEIPAGATIAGAGADNTTLNVNNDKIAKDNVTLKDMTIKGSGSQGTSGTLNVNGNNTTIENIDYKGDGNIAIAVSTGGSNSGTTFRGTKITNAFRGIQFWSLSGDSVIDNCVLDVAGYTFNIDAAAAGSTLTITNSTLNGWTSYTSGIDLVTFDSCKLGLNAYSYLRPYSETMLINCEFTSDGYQLNAGGSDAYTITLTNCTKNGTLITADNVKTLLLDTDEWNSNTTLIVNGVTVSV